jgi:hypothetical protein
MAQCVGIDDDRTRVKAVPIGEGGQSQVNFGQKRGHRSAEGETRRNYKQPRE